MNEFLSMSSKLFGGASLTDEESEPAKEVMLMTLARAAASDTNIKSVEIDKVQKFCKPVPEKNRQLTFELQPTQRCSKVSLDKYLARSGKNLELEERVQIIDALREVIGSTIVSVIWKKTFSTWL